MADEICTGRIVRSLSGFYDVRLPGRTVVCRGRGSLRKARVTPLTGDLVRITADGDRGMVEEILPRKNSFVRPAAANLDALVLFASGAVPVTDPFLIDRVTAIAGSQGVECLICVNKTDLDPAEDLYGIYARAGYRVIRTSAVTGAGIAELRECLRGRLTAFTGNTGVGKSSVLNALCPGLGLETGEVSRKLGRGKHTTRHVELFALDGETFVMDTPGFSSFDVEEMDIILKEDLPYAFPDFAPYLESCRYTDCSHREEPGCRVREAADAGLLERTRYESYRALYEQSAKIRPWELEKQTASGASVKGHPAG